MAFPLQIMSREAQWWMWIWYDMNLRDILKRRGHLVKKKAMFNCTSSVMQDLDRWIM